MSRSSLRTFRFAGRAALGRPSPTTLAVQGIRHRRLNELNPEAETETIIAVGAACSTVFSGKNLYEVLNPGFELEQSAMDALSRGEPAPPLCIHTSAGTPQALQAFLQSIAKHVPWRDHEDWFVSLQVEGASAVYAACDLLIQLQGVRGRPEANRVAVGQWSYHGPQATSFGSGKPLPSLKPKSQLHFPVPAPASRAAGESHETFYGRCLSKFEAFLDVHGWEIGVLLVEPQWGSSLAGLPWPKDLLKAYITKAQERGILVCCDEIMCGLARHGQGPGLFLSDHRVWDLEPDAVTFGKALGGGVYPISGCIVRRGALALGEEGRSVMQSHTYSGASTRALMAGEAVLEKVPEFYEHVAKMGGVCSEIFDELEEAADGAAACQGQGLLWGAMFEDREALDVMKAKCESAGVWPYFVPAGGFMVSPPLDTTEAELREVGERLVSAMEATVASTRHAGTAHATRA